jgi:hypothetical protein
MNTAHFDEFIRSRAGTRRSLAGGTLAMLTGWLAAPASDARKKHKRKRKHKKTGGEADSPPMQPNSPGEGVDCEGGVVVDGVCRPCDVCASGCSFATVQVAIDAATAGATIAICPGTYAENLTIAKDVRLVGAGAGTDPRATIVRGTGATSVVKTKTANVVLQNLRITGGRGDGGGISNLGTTLKVIGCTVSENTDPGASGGGIYNTGHLDLIESTVTANESASGGGIYTVGRNAILQLTNSVIRENTANDGGGMFVHDGAEVRFDAASRVTGNTAKMAGGGAFVSTTAGRVSLVSSANVSSNTPTNCGGTAVELCSGTVTRR